MLTTETPAYMRTPCLLPLLLLTGPLLAQPSTPAEIRRWGIRQITQTTVYTNGEKSVEVRLFDQHGIDTAAYRDSVRIWQRQVVTDREGRPALVRHLVEGKLQATDSMVYAPNGAYRVYKTDWRMGPFTEAEYDSLGRLKREVMVDGTEIVPRYDARGRQVATLIRDAAGQERSRTVMTLDAAGRVIESRRTGGNSPIRTTYKVNSRGLPTEARFYDAKTGKPLDFHFRFAYEFNPASREI